MKKVSALISSLISYFALVRPAFAQETFNICPVGSDFNNLCDFSRFSFGQIVYTVIVLLLIVAVVIAVVFLIIGGIRWILSGGDKGAVETARNTIIGAIVGLVIAFAAFFIINIVAQIFLGNSITTLTLPTF